MVDQYVQVGTLNEIETFHQFLMHDLYREEKPINFSEAFSQGREIDKKYYIVPLKLTSAPGDVVSYSIDRDLIKYVDKINRHGYKELQKNIIVEMDEMGLTNQERVKHMEEHMLVKEDKKHKCYNFIQLF